MYCLATKLIFAGLFASCCMAYVIIVQNYAKSVEQPLTHTQFKMLLKKMVA